MGEGTRVNTVKSRLRLAAVVGGARSRGVGGGRPAAIPSPRPRPRPPSRLGFSVPSEADATIEGKSDGDVVPSALSSGRFRACGNVGFGFSIVGFKRHVTC